jgi:ferritin
MPSSPVAVPVVKQLQRQLNHELGASHAYTMLAVWCMDRNFKGFARYFYKQAGEEREHAQRFIDHLLDRGIVPELREVPAPRAKYASLLEIARHAQSMERENTKGIHQAYAAALKANDLAAQVALHWFISEQVEEENWSDEMVERVELAETPGGQAALDRHIARYLEDNPQGTATEG